MTDQELKRLFNSFPVSPGFITLQCLKCGESSNHLLDAGETVGQAKRMFGASHKCYCSAVTGQAIPQAQG